MASRTSAYSTSARARVDDLHAAFADPGVDGILTVLGSFNANEMLDLLDTDLISANPKVLCGYSDITPIQGALLAQCNLVTYSGPHWSTFGMRDHAQETIDGFVAAVMADDPIEVRPSPWYTEDLWFLDQDERETTPSPGWWELREGEAEGRIVGANLRTLRLLVGTPSMPSLDGALLFLEDDAASTIEEFRAGLVHLLQLPGAVGVTGLVIGRFQDASEVERDALQAAVDAVPGLRGRPVLAGVDIGHTNPMMTYPIGGRARLVVAPGKTSLTITRH